MEQDHAVRRREEAKRIRLEQERDYAKFQEQLKLMKKEVNMCWAEAGHPGRMRALSAANDQTPAQPHLSNKGYLEELTYLRSACPGMSGSASSSCAIRSPFSIYWALPSSVWTWLQAGPCLVASGNFLDIPPA